MWDTFRPLRLTPLWQSDDNPAYALLLERGEGRVLRGAAGQHLSLPARYDGGGPVWERALRRRLT